VPATLRSLRIRNLALVDVLDWELAPGFSAVTGETGAGKSIILGALKLLLGERADKNLIRAGEEQCSVEALFELEDSTAIDHQLVEQGIDPCEERVLLLRRIFNLNGSSRVFVNGSQATLGLLRNLGDRLVDLHGPHDHQSLLIRDSQLQLVDAFAQNDSLTKEFAALHASLLNDEEELATLKTNTSGERLNLLQHQFKELESAGLRAGEFADLSARFKVAANAQRIMELALQAQAALSEDENSVLALLANVSRSLSDLVRLDETTNTFIANLRSGALELEELAQNLRVYQQSLDLDPASLRQMEDRWNLVQGLQRKYNRDEGALLDFQNELAETLSKSSERYKLIEALQLRIEHQKQEAQRLATELTVIRRKSAKRLAAQIQQHLLDLGFRQSTFEIACLGRGRLSATGADEVEFLFAPNPGEPLKPLRAIASSGEISRVMLALKTALAHEDLIGLLVFDEIDANVGGEIANAIAAKMKALGDSRQVLAITHLPQVAAQASRQYQVAKHITDGRTRTSMLEVKGRDRIEELARMLGGRSKSALQHAEALLKG
jgi:DNA repair protein RecN (Recombination protein N)